MKAADDEKRTLHKAIAAALFCAFVVAWVCLVTGCDRKTEKPAAAARPTFVATATPQGTSMLPVFASDETVALELCAFSELRARDTVVYWHDAGKQYVHHRLIRRDTIDGRWITQGDNNPGQDSGRMTSDEFVGRTRKLAPKGR